MTCQPAARAATPRPRPQTPARRTPARHAPACQTPACQTPAGPVPARPDPDHPDRDHHQGLPIRGHQLPGRPGKDHRVPSRPVPHPPATSPRDAAPGSTPPGPGTPAGSPASPGTPAGSLPGDHGSAADRWPGVPPLADADAPGPDDGYADPLPEPDDDDRLRYGEDPLDLPGTGPLPAWPPVPGTTGTRPLTTTRDGAAASPASTGRGPGMLDLTLSRATLTGSSAPGPLGRIGPVTATQARALAAASTAPGTRWRVILTDDNGRAITTATVTRRLTLATRAPAGSPGTTGGPMLSLTGPHASITGRVSVTLPVTALDHIIAAELAGTSTRAAILRAAAKAAAKIRRQATADQDADSDCAHTTASAAYRPPPTIRDLIEARDQACRFPGCRQPAWRGDLDHTTPVPLRRTDLPLQSRTAVPATPPTQAATGLDSCPDSPRHLPLAHTRRTDTHHHRTSARRLNDCAHWPSGRSSRASRQPAPAARPARTRRRATSRRRGRTCRRMASDCERVSGQKRRPAAPDPRSACTAACRPGAL